MERGKTKAKTGTKKSLLDHENYKARKFRQVELIITETKLNNET